KVHYYRLIRVEPTQHTRRYPRSGGRPNTLGLTFEQWDNVHYYSLMGNGNMPIPGGDYRMLYQFFLRKYPTSDGLIPDQLRFETTNGNNTFRIGDIYYGEETGLYNRGASAEIRVGENIFLQGSFTHSDLLPSSLYRFRKEAIAAAGVRMEGNARQTTVQYIYQDDQLLDTRVNMLFSRHRRKIGNAAALESGVGVSSETFQGKTVFDLSAFADFELHIGYLDLSSDNRYSGSSYPFINRGNSHSRQMATYAPGGRFSYHAALLWQQYTPEYRALPPTASSDYRNNRGLLGISLAGKRFNYRLESGLGSNRLYAPYLNRDREYRNQEVFAQGSIQFTAPRIRILLKQELSRIIPLDPLHAPYYAGRTEMDIAFFDTYLSLFLNRGAYTFYDQANYVLNGYSRDFFLARVHRSFPVVRNFSVKLSADHYKDHIFDYQANTILIAPRLTVGSFEVNYEAGYRGINGNRFFLHNLSVYKTFGNPLEARYDLH